ncbi:MAG: FAD-dependent oxidoreductase [Alphaproteobacteria bacterium]|nr:FAD-dependent oxidoreductase [Alphaproteobacteria bacterium]
MKPRYLSKPQFAAELEKCLKCPAKPCAQACPVKCSPHDFIAAAQKGDIKQAAALIVAQNPLGEVCGLICPDKFCTRACLRQHIDAPIKIPQVQAEIMRRAREDNLLPPMQNVAPNGKRIAIIGAGPSGIGAAAELIQHGFQVTIFEKNETIGGALNLIPQMRLPREIIEAEWQYLAQNPLVEAYFKTTVADYPTLLQQGFAAVIVAVGAQKSRTLGIEGENLLLDYTEYLQNPAHYATAGNVAIVGGGAAAVDCVLTAKAQGAANVEMFVRRRLSDMRITATERQALLENQVDITTMTRVTRVVKSGNTLTAYTCKTRFNTDGRLEDVPQTEIVRSDFALIILALGATRAQEPTEAENIFYVGDFVGGGSTAVEALASGKQIAQEVAKKLKI